MDVQAAFSEVLAKLVGVDILSPDSHFFDDLGADSMVMAHFCAKIRKRDGLPSVSMKDIYRHPTVRLLAEAVAQTPTTNPTKGADPRTADDPPTLPLPTRLRLSSDGPVGTASYLLCGLLQLLFFLAYTYLVALVVTYGLRWIAAGVGLVNIYLRAVTFSAVGFVTLCTVPIVAKWVLVGRWAPGRIRVWSLRYLRFWVVKTLIRTNPLARFVGSPIYLGYLRLLGAKIGRGAVIFSRTVPVCTDLLTVGAGAVIRKDSVLAGYRARAGWIEIGPVTLGDDAYVGEMTVLDIGTSMGAGARLAHASSLSAGQSVPAGEHWHGTPGRRAGTTFPAVEPARCGRVRRFIYSVLQLARLLLVYLPLAGMVPVLLFTRVPTLGELLAGRLIPVTDGTLFRNLLVVTAVLFFGSLLMGLVLVTVVPRLLNLFLRPDRTYRLYGIRYVLHTAISGLANRRAFTYLFGDSSYIVYYLQALGYRLKPIIQTGSNFGLSVRQDNPFLTEVGSGTMIADGLSVVNADYSNTSFRVSRVAIGAHNYLGNEIVYPVAGRTGENCLLGTRVAVPVDGEIRENTGLLGSPAFEIPRSVERDSRFDGLRTGAELRRRLKGKNRHNLATITCFMLSRWAHLYLIFLIGAVAADSYPLVGAAALQLGGLCVLFATVAYYIFLERLTTGFRAQRPLYCSIYHREFWRHERFWKLAEWRFVHTFNGTPFKSVVWRMLGARVGRRLFDDGARLSEKTLVTIGDEVTLNAGVVLQCHSQEDGTFKSDHIDIGSNVTLGVNSFVHYGAHVGRAAELDADAFLMKGEEVTPASYWSGNPAAEVRASRPLPIELSSRTTA